MIPTEIAMIYCQGCKHSGMAFFDAKNFGFICKINIDPNNFDTKKINQCPSYLPDEKEGEELQDSNV